MHKQSSLWGMASGSAIAPTNGAISGGRLEGIVGGMIVCWMHWFPKVVALMTPVCLAMG